MRPTVLTIDLEHLVLQHIIIQRICAGKNPEDWERRELDGVDNLFSEIRNVLDLYQEVLLAAVSEGAPVQSSDNTEAA